MLVGSYQDYSEKRVHVQSMILGSPTNHDLHDTAKLEEE